MEHCNWWLAVELGRRFVFVLLIVLFPRKQVIPVPCLVGCVPTCLSITTVSSGGPTATSMHYADILRILLTLQRCRSERH